MPWFHRKPEPGFDRERLQPAVRKSFCNREMTLGFIEKANGRFHSYCCAYSQEEVEDFCAKYGINPQELKSFY